jgi:hypothetical protein
VGVWADRQDLDAFLLCRGQETFQLPELRYAVRSPITPVEYEDHMLLPSKLG